MTTENKILTSELKDQATKIMAQYDQPRSAVLPILHLVQNTYGCITCEAETEIAALLQMPIVDMKEIVTFYTLFRSRPCAKVEFNVCRTLSCMLRGGEEIIDHLKEKLGIQPGEQTSDGKFGLHLVECLGACETAPTAQINESYVGGLTKEKIDQIISGKTK